jgi:hypothetical protein
MNNTQRKAVVQEFEDYLSSKDLLFDKEIVFSKIMDTKRRFRADYSIMLDTIVEINGGQWTGGRHNRGGKGYENDLTKLNLAQKHGFKIYQFTYEMLLRQEYKNYF